MFSIKILPSNSLGQFHVCKVKEELRVTYLFSSLLCIVHCFFFFPYIASSITRPKENGGEIKILFDLSLMHLSASFDYL